MAQHMLTGVFSRRVIDGVRPGYMCYAIQTTVEDPRIQTLKLPSIATSSDPIVSGKLRMVGRVSLSWFLRLVQRTSVANASVIRHGWRMMATFKGKPLMRAFMLSRKR
ncbi:9-cis-epoxycarotenoid dioxygenase protein [Rutstroemia sp. NJR-2017a WRK4]|nr:9-cis-epoxycarotenoid dioxygenase protein [Rutstroemia sp. NJR-2017a WRK4]